MQKPSDRPRAFLRELGSAAFHALCFLYHHVELHRDLLRGEALAISACLELQIAVYAERTFRCVLRWSHGSGDPELAGIDAELGVRREREIELLSLRIGDL